MNHANMRNIFTLLKNKIENNSTREGAFYQNALIKINSIWVISFFHLMCVVANASKLFYTANLANIERFLYHSNLSFQKYKFYTHVNSPVWVDKNHLKYEKVHFLFEMSEINSWWFIFNLLEWTHFKCVKCYRLKLL